MQDASDTPTKSTDPSTHCDNGLTDSKSVSDAQAIPDASCESTEGTEASADTERATAKPAASTPEVNKQQETGPDMLHTSEMEVQETDASSVREITPEILQAADTPTGWWGRKFRKLESFVSRLSYRNNFWHRLCSLFFLRLAFKSGIRLGQQKGDYYETVVPFSKFNKNWYNAMAGAALLANSEVAGGMYIFQHVGSHYTVVCKELHYKFRLPIHGPALYRVTSKQDVKKLMRENMEFNITVEMDIIQAVKKKGERERKCGKCTTTFHVAPKALMRQRKLKQKQRAQEKARKEIKAHHEIDATRRASASPKDNTPNN